MFAGRGGRGTSRTAIRAVVVALAAALLGLGAPTTARAADDSTIAINGYGWGHGRGMGQWGAYGYAVDYGWTPERILDHYYGGTTASTLPPGSLMTVRLTAYDDIAVRVSSGRPFTISGYPIAAGSVGWVTWEGSGWVLHTAYGCAEPEAWSTPVGDPTFVPSQPDSTSSGLDRMLSVCEGTTPRYYRGNLRMALDGAGLRTVNVAGIDDYVRGVVPVESIPSWPQPALMAQAVAARSYAMSENRYPYAKTCDTTSCQVYRGAARGTTRYEYASTDQATSNTAGGVRLTGAGAVARTEFSSSTGGWTAGGTFPAVEDLGDAVAANPRHTWTAPSLTGAAVSSRYGLGTFVSAEVIARNGLGAEGGRVLQVRLVGSANTVIRTGGQFRSDWGLFSDWFSLTVTTPPPPPGSSNIWYFRNSVSTGMADGSRTFGVKGDTPLTCDWNGDSYDTPGRFNGGSWQLTNSNFPNGPVDTPFGFGNPGDIPVCGDWNGDGVDTIGVFRAGIWYLRNTPGGGPAEVVLAYGQSGDVPVVGDWVGDGRDHLGVRRGQTWFLNLAPVGATSTVSFAYGEPGDRPVVGDWNGDGTDTVGIVRDGQWYLRNAPRSGGAADVPPFGYGDPGDMALAGDFDGNRTSTPVIVRSP